MSGEALTILIPKNSFVQKQSLYIPNCAEEVKLCLPVFDADDVSFQFNSNIEFGFYHYTIVSGGIESGYINLPNKIKDGELDLVDFVGIDEALLNAVACGACFTIKLYGSIDDGKIGDPLFETNCFQKICDDCWTSKIEYSCDEDSFGFDYAHSYTVMGHKTHFYNAIRLPFYLSEPQYPVKRNVFIKSDGSRKKLSARIENSYELIVGYMPKDWHEKLIVALEHDAVKITNINSGMKNQTFTQEKDYKIDWQRFLDYPTATANGQLMLTPYFNVNSNCS